MGGRSEEEGRYGSGVAEVGRGQDSEQEVRRKGNVGGRVAEGGRRQGRGGRSEEEGQDWGVKSEEEGIYGGNVAEIGRGRIGK